jgi:Ribbon-helix-helix protein, copG family
MKRISLFVSLLQLAALKAISKRTGLSMAEHIRAALTAYIKKNKASTEESK